MVWIWNLTSDRAGSAELNAPPDTVIVAWAATREEAPVRNGVTTAPSWMPVSVSETVDIVAARRTCH
ncbi:MAG TPA: hypothetical protein VNF47_20595 [Streptosporangiaceae bacterium]|nr:hypothetical protein [Streptosporangiaceae bacterium]